MLVRRKKKRVERFAANAKAGGLNAAVKLPVVTDPELLAKMEARSKRFATPATTA